MRKSLKEISGYLFISACILQQCATSSCVTSSYCCLSLLGLPPLSRSARCWAITGTHFIERRTLQFDIGKDGRLRGSTYNSVPKQAMRLKRTHNLQVASVNTRLRGASACRKVCTLLLTNTLDRVSAHGGLRRIQATVLRCCIREA